MTLRVKLDHNVPASLVPILDERGIDVATVAEQGHATSDDQTVGAAAAAENRVLVTLDRGFADPRRHARDGHAGVLVLRPRRQTPALLRALLLAALDALSADEFYGRVVVAEPGRLRVR